MSEASMPAPVPTVDRVLGFKKIQDIEGFVEEATIDLFDIKAGTKLISVFDDDLSEVYRFKQAPQNSHELAQMLMARYKLDEDLENELTEMIDQLVDLGLDIEREHKFLVQAIEEVMEEGTVSVADDIAAQLGLDAEDTQGQQIKPKSNEITWGQTGLIAAIGIGLSSALKSWREKGKKAEQTKPESLELAA